MQGREAHRKTVAPESLESVKEYLSRLSSEVESCSESLDGTTPITSEDVEVYLSPSDINRGFDSITSYEIEDSLPPEQRSINQGSHSLNHKVFLYERGGRRYVAGGMDLVEAVGRIESSTMPGLKSLLETFRFKTRRLGRRYA